MGTIFYIHKHEIEQVTTFNKHYSKNVLAKYYFLTDGRKNG